MKKGARDGKACGAPRCKSGRDGVCLEFYVGYFLCFKTSIENESFSLQFYFGVITESLAVSYNRLLAEKYKIALHILQLHRTKKQPDEDPMKKGARDGKACGIV